MKYVIPTRDWVEFLKARLADIVNDGLIPKEELRHSHSVCTHVVRHLLIMRLRELMEWYTDELELGLVADPDLLITMDVEIHESLATRIFPNFTNVIGVIEKPNLTLQRWGELVELEVLEPLDSFIQDHINNVLSLEPTWDVFSVKQMGNSYILQRGEDYRGLFWDKYRPLAKR